MFSCIVTYEQALWPSTSLHASLDPGHATKAMFSMYDFLVIGGGISGASAAFELAAHGSTLLLEAETQPGYHSTGRSAALYTRHFGGPVVRRINHASADFFTDSPSGFSDQPLLFPRGGVTIAPPGDENALAVLLATTIEQSGPDHGLVEISPKAVLDMAPFIRPERIGAAFQEVGIEDIDVAAMHQAYLRAFKARGGTLKCDGQVDRLDRTKDGWQVHVGDDHFATRIVVNAAGAWAGQIGALANAADLGLVAKRRTAVVLDAPSGAATAGEIRTMPVVDYCGSDAYWKPDAGRFMASLGDATPDEPQDAQPDDFDIAVLMDWVGRETLLDTSRIGRSWAGLRTFVADGAPVVGFDTKAKNFFWLAGQGGYGIMMAPALAEATAGLIVSDQWPETLHRYGVTRGDLTPGRFEQA